MDKRKGPVSQPGQVREDWYRMLPDEGQRKAVAQIFSDTIKKANAVHPAGWMISHNPGVPHIRMNIGRLFVLTLRSDDLSFVLDSTLTNPGEIPGHWLNRDLDDRFKVVPELSWSRGPTQEVVSRWEDLRPSFFSAVEKACQTSQLSPWGRFHLNEAVDVLKGETGENLPYPDFSILSPSSLEEMLELIDEFVESYPPSQKGRDHIRLNIESQKSFLDSFARLKEKRKEGKDITDEVLVKLLPHANTPHNIEKGAWTTIAPVITRDIYQLFEGAKWASPNDWPEIANLIMDFFETCEGDPASLESACKTFAEKTPAKGFQAAILSAGLMALNPDHFAIINKKPLLALKWFAHKKHSSSLLQYPGANRDLLELVEVASEQLSMAESLSEIHPAYQFDMFTHWVVAVRKYKPGQVRYWKIAPGKQAWNWEECQRQGKITLGWDKFGDLSEVTREDFDALAQKLENEDEKNYKTTATLQAWTFANEIHPGDRIIANKGTTKVLDVGTVDGPYSFLADARHGHHLPVVWDNREPLEVSARGWRRTIVSLKKKKFEELVGPENQAVKSGATTSDNSNAWLFQANPKIFNLERELKMLSNEALASWRVTRYRDEIKVGDNVLLWQSGKEAGVYALAVITGPVTPATPEEIEASEDIKSTNYMAPIQITEIFDSPILKTDLLETGYFENMQVFRNAQGTNFRVSEAEWAALKELISPADQGLPPLSLEEIAEETGFELTEMKRWVAAINRKGQGILYGPPGTGKTFVADLLAQNMAGGGDGFVDLVQFHPAYTYEDFIQGLRPEAAENGGLDYRMVPGRFREFCRKAAKCQDPCVLIVDEINRANLARVFGELMYLMEYRDEAIPLAGGGELSIPKNVRIIGTMNTADRSIALVDHALRRRFAFIALRPQYHVMENYHNKNGFPAAGLVKVLKRLNDTIDDPHYEVGISFFMRENLSDHLEDIWRMEIEPYLEEYFFDQAEKAKEFRWEKIAGELQ